MANAVTSEEEKKELTAEQKKELFDNWEKARAKLVAAAHAVDHHVRVIHAHMGSGPFRWQGQEISIAKARFGDRYTIRTKNQQVEEIV